MTEHRNPRSRIFHMDEYLVAVAMNDIETARQEAEFLGSVKPLCLEIADRVNRGETIQEQYDAASRDGMTRRTYLLGCILGRYCMTQANLDNWYREDGEAR